MLVLLRAVHNQLHRAPLVRSAAALKILGDYRDYSLPALLPAGPDLPGEVLRYFDLRLETLGFVGFVGLLVALASLASSLGYTPALMTSLRHSPRSVKQLP